MIRLRRESRCFLSPSCLSPWAPRAAVVSSRSSFVRLPGLATDLLGSINSSRVFLSCPFQHVLPPTCYALALLPPFSSFHFFEVSIPPRVAGPTFSCSLIFPLLFLLPGSFAFKTQSLHFLYCRCPSLGWLLDLFFLWPFSRISPPLIFVPFFLILGSAFFSLLAGSRLAGLVFDFFFRALRVWLSCLRPRRLCFVDDIVKLVSPTDHVPPFFRFFDLHPLCPDLYCTFLALCFFFGLVSIRQRSCLASFCGLILSSLLPCGW